MNQMTTFILKNKINDFNDNKISIEIDDKLHPCWIAWKYLIDVLFSKGEKKIKKEFICSIIKKEESNKNEIIHLFLTHLDYKEIQIYINKL